MFNPDTAMYFKFYLEPFEAAAIRWGRVDRTAAEIEGLITSLTERPDAGLAVMPAVGLSTQVKPFLLRADEVIG